MRTLADVRNRIRAERSGMKYRDVGAHANSVICGAFSTQVLTLDC